MMHTNIYIKRPEGESALLGSSSSDSAPHRSQLCVQWHRNSLVLKVIMWLAHTRDFSVCVHELAAIFLCTSLLLETLTSAPSGSFCCAPICNIYSLAGCRMHTITFHYPPDEKFLPLFLIVLIMLMRKSIGAALLRSVYVTFQRETKSIITVCVVTLSNSYNIAQLYIILSASTQSLSMHNETGVVLDA